MNTISLILLAGGIGTRMGSDIPKVFLPIKGKPIALYSFDLFTSLAEIQEIVVVCPKNHHSFFPRKTLFASPGKERQDSVASGLKKTSGEFIMIHDSARPFITKEEVYHLLEEGIPVGAAALGVPAKNTIKEISSKRLVEKTLKREDLYEMHTPQLLRREILEEGLRVAGERKWTDDVALAELIGHPVKVVEGRRDNFKITYPIDLQLASLL